MVCFRLYFLKNDHIVSFEEFEALDEAEALGLASELAAGSEVELWCGKRKVAHVERRQPESALPEGR